MRKRERSGGWGWRGEGRVSEVGDGGVEVQE